MTRAYRQPMGGTWFLRRRRWTLFMIRELTAVGIAAYLLFLLVFLGRLGDGPEAFARFLAMLTSPLAVGLHVVALAAAAWHAVTWFNLTPQVMPVRLGTRRVPGPWIAVATGYVPWLVISALVIWAVQSWQG